jgi:hypothetical protein
MRYIRKEKIITTICNEDVVDNDVINSVLESLKSNIIEFSMSTKKYFPSLGDYRNTYYNKVRVDSVEDSQADFMIFDKSSTTHLRGIPFSDIVEINAITTVDKILTSKINPTRFDFLDIIEE